MEIIKPEEMEKREGTNIRKVKETKTPLVPPGLDMGGITQSPDDIPMGTTNYPESPLNSIDTPVVENFQKNIRELSKAEFCIPYEPLCNDKIIGIPKELNYRPIDGFLVTKLNELNLTTIDEGLNEVLDATCYETKFEGFSHWVMPVNEKIRSFLNLRLNSSGPVIEHLFGLCAECGKEKLFTKVEIKKFDETELKKKYKEPFPLKAKVNDKEVKFKARLLQSGDIYKAKQIYEKNKDYISKMFPEAIEKDAEVITQILEYTNSILEIDTKPAVFDEALSFCKDNIQVMNALTSFNDFFFYGMNLETEDTCGNKECPSVSTDVKTGKSKKRRCQFRFPLQPNLFFISYTEKESVEQYFDM